MKHDHPIKNDSPEKKGVLFVVATPIGNLGDMTDRAIKTLARVDIVACEDTRHTKKLFNYYNISTKLFSYYREKEQEKSSYLLKKLHAGKDVALVSDAGTPAICDPGSILVQKARAAGIRIETIAGPSALTAALSIAGLAQAQFYFGGFLPAQTNERKKHLHNLATLPCPLIFYESPHRVITTLTDMLDVFGDRYAQIFRELTKIHEECIEGKLTTILEHLKERNKGEFVILVHSNPACCRDKPDDLDKLLLWYKDELHSSLKDAVRDIAHDLNIPRSQVYRQALLVWKQNFKPTGVG